MKKAIIILSMIFLSFTPVNAERSEVKENPNNQFLSNALNIKKGIIYCDYYNDGLHRMVSSGAATVLSTKGASRFVNWGLFICNCGHNIVRAGVDTTYGQYFSDIPETDIYILSYGFANVVTDRTPSFSSASTWPGYIWQYLRKI